MSEECVFCDGSQSLAVLMREALSAKHCGGAQEADTIVDVLLQQTEATGRMEQYTLAQYREYSVLDMESEFMKREYRSNEMEEKIKMLSQYYKFHSDVPRVVEKTVQGILNKHHNAKREYDYKRIKRILKEEQGMSITSVEESDDESRGEKKSKYSDMLDDMDNEDSNMSESNVLKELCKQIDKSLPKHGNDAPVRFRGSFQTDKYFEDYLLGEQNKVKQEKKKSTTSNRASGIQSLLRKIRGKPEKFVYNTNIRIEIRNAKFYSNTRDNMFSNFVSGDQPSNKFITEVYKSNRKIDDRVKSRLVTRDSKDISRSKQKKNFHKQKHPYQDKETILYPSRLTYGPQSLNPSKEKLSRKSLHKEQLPTASRMSGEKRITPGTTSRKNLRDFQGIKNGIQCHSVKKIIPPPTDNKITSRLRSNTMTNLHSSSQRKIVGVYTRSGKDEGNLNIKQNKGRTVFSIKELLDRKLAFDKI